MYQVNRLFELRAKDWYEFFMTFLKCKLKYLLLHFLYSLLCAIRVWLAKQGTHRHLVLNISDPRLCLPIKCLLTRNNAFTAIYSRDRAVHDPFCLP